MSNIFSNPRSVGALQPFVSNNPLNIIALRAPTTSDKAPIGQLWIDTASNTTYLLTSITSGQFNWTTLGGTGGGTFETVTITGPGNPVLDVTGNSVFTGGINATGAFQSVSTTQTTIESSLAGSASSIFLNASAGTGGVTVEAGSGGITLDALNGPIDIESGTGAITIGTEATNHNVTVGSTNGTCTTTLQAGTGGIALSAAGNVRLVPATASIASPSDTANVNERVIVATFTGFTTAMGASDTLGINSTFITATSGLLVTIASLNTSGNGALLTLDGVITGVGGCVISYTNNGTGALGAGDNIIVTVLVVS